MHKQSNASLLFSSISTPKNSSTHTVKDQLEQLEASLQHHQKIMEAHKKTHNQLYLQIKNLQQRAAHTYQETMNKIDESVDKTVMVLLQLQKHNNNDYDSLEIQKHELEDGHRAVAVKAEGLADQCQNLIVKVGL